MEPGYNQFRVCHQQVFLFCKDLHTVKEHVKVEVRSRRKISLFISLFSRPSGYKLQLEIPYSYIRKSIKTNSCVDEVVNNSHN